MDEGRHKAPDFAEPTENDSSHEQDHGLVREEHAGVPELRRKSSSFKQSYRYSNSEYSEKLRVVKPDLKIYNPVANHNKRLI